MKRRVCVFCETWASGGIESFLSNVLLNGDLAGLEIDVVACVVTPSVFTEDLRKKGIQIRALSGHKRRLRENCRELRALLKEGRYDVFHANLFHGLGSAYLRAAEAAGVPVRIAHSHSAAFRRSPGLPLKYLAHAAGKMAFRGAATDYWACSGIAADFLFPRGTPFRFIPNGIDTERFRFRPQARAAARAELGLGDALTIGHVGRLCSQKNQAFLLDAFAAFRARRPDSRLLLVGEGSDLWMLTDRAERLGIRDGVIFYGTSPRIEALLWAMDLCAFPSRFEGLGIVAVEAQAAGLPLLCSTAVPKEALLLPDVRALPLSAGADAWAEALFSMRGQAGSREGCASAVCARGFDIRAVSSGIMAFYRGEAGARAKGESEA